MQRAPPGSCLASSLLQGLHRELAESRKKRISGTYAVALDFRSRLARLCDDAEGAWSALPPRERPAVTMDVHALLNEAAADRIPDLPLQLPDAGRFYSDCFRAAVGQMGARPGLARDHTSPASLRVVLRACQACARSAVRCEAPDTRHEIDAFADCLSEASTEMVTPEPHERQRAAPRQAPGDHPASHPPRASADPGRRDDDAAKPPGDDDDRATLLSYYDDAEFDLSGLF